MKDLQEAISTFHQAVDSASKAGSSLREQEHRLSIPSDIGQNIGGWRRGGTDELNFVFERSESPEADVRDQFMRTGDMKDLQEAVSTFRQGSFLRDQLKTLKVKIANHAIFIPDNNLEDTVSITAIDNVLFIHQSANNFYKRPKVSKSIAEGGRKTLAILVLLGEENARKTNINCST